MAPPAPGSGSDAGADAVGSQVQCFVRRMWGCPSNLSHRRPCSLIARACLIALATFPRQQPPLGLVSSHRHSPALARFRHDPLNVSVALEPDVFSNSLAVIAEAIAKRDWVCGLLDADANRKQILRDDMITEGRDVDDIAIPSIAEIVGLRPEGSSRLQLGQAFYRFPPDRPSDFTVHWAGRRISCVGNDATTFHTCLLIQEEPSHGTAEGHGAFFAASRSSRSLGNAHDEVVIMDCCRGVSQYRFHRVNISQSLYAGLTQHPS